MAQGDSAQGKQPASGSWRWGPSTATRGNLTLWILAVLAGVCAGYGAVVFRIAIDWTQLIYCGSSSEQVLAMAAKLDWWRILLAPAAGGLWIGLFVYYAMPGRRPEPRSAAKARWRRPWRAGWVRDFASAALKLLGVIFHKDAIAAYNAELLRRRAEEQGKG